jgi:hypothetical protein
MTQNTFKNVSIILEVTMIILMAHYRRFEVTYVLIICRVNANTFITQMDAGGSPKLPVLSCNSTQHRIPEEEYNITIHRPVEFKSRKR